MFIFWRYGSTYRQVDFVMEVAHENDGWPLARGLLDPGGEEWVLGLRKTPSGYVLERDPSVAFAPGRRVRVWWSDAAPGRGVREGPFDEYDAGVDLPRGSRGSGTFSAGWLPWWSPVSAGCWLAGCPSSGRGASRTETLLDEAPEPRT